MPSPDSPPSIQVADLHKYYGDVVAVNALTFTLAPGTTCGLPAACGLRPVGFRPSQLLAGHCRSGSDFSCLAALSIVRHPIERGIPPQRLAATGFGEFRPLDNGDSPESFARNRRIELKLTGP